ncbi:MAG: hypothetical protein OXG67_00525 [bacterium]|nr:hypothetical protein [bacterium]MCY3889501.1 hypothetical protein [bacterium]
MDQTILALLGVIITLMLYLDRGRRADLALHRKETQRGFAQVAEAIQSGDTQLREEIKNGDTQLREEIKNGDAQLREEMHRGFAHLHERIDKLTEVVMDLVRRVGRLEGRADAEAASAQPSQ